MRQNVEGKSIEKLKQSQACPLANKKSHKKGPDLCYFSRLFLVQRNKRRGKCNLISLYNS